MADSSAQATLPSHLPRWRVLIDTNVVLDLVLGREPWASQAKPMWAARDSGRLEMYLPVSVLTDIFYVSRKQIGSERAKAAIEECLRRFVIFPLDRTIVEAALILPGSDFEDNMQIACAVSAGLDLIVTRNTGDFSHTPIEAVEPLEIIARLSL